ncbi:MAG: divergent polysaccharide deacetylase family protein, partial [Pseudomonadota bacterium]
MAQYLPFWKRLPPELRESALAVCLVFGALTGGIGIGTVAASFVDSAPWAGEVLTGSQTAPAEDTLAALDPETDAAPKPVAQPDLIDAIPDIAAGADGAGERKARSPLARLPGWPFEPRPVDSKRPAPDRPSTGEAESLASGEGSPAAGIPLPIRKPAVPQQSVRGVGPQSLVPPATGLGPGSGSASSIEPGPRDERAPHRARPAIAIILDDMGHSAKVTAKVASIPGPLSLAFLPYGNSLPEQTRRARSAGHEIWAHIPMEPFGPDDPGPRALLTGLTPEQNVSRFVANLDAVGPVAGFNNHMGSRFTATRHQLEPLMKVARTRGLLYVDSRTSGRSIALDVARRHGIPSAGR